MNEKVVETLLVIYIVVLKVVRVFISGFAYLLTTKQCCITKCTHFLRSPLYLVLIAQHFVPEICSLL